MCASTSPADWAWTLSTSPAVSPGVIAVERDAALARAAEINFRRLGADNITVVCTGG